MARRGGDRDRHRRHRDRLHRTGVAAGHVGDRRAARTARHPDGVAVRRVPRPQPGADIGDRGDLRHRRDHRRQCAQVQPGPRRRLCQSREHRRLRGTRAGGRDGSRVGARRCRRLPRAWRPRAPRVRRDRIVHRPRLRLLDPLPRPRLRRRRVGPHPGPRRGDRLSPIARRAAPFGAAPHPPPAHRHQRAGGRRARRRRRAEGAADRLPAPAGRFRHAAGLGVRPRLRVALRAGRLAGAHDHRRRPRARCDPQPSPRPAPGRRSADPR